MVSAVLIGVGAALTGGATVGLVTRHYYPKDREEKKGMYNEMFQRYGIGYEGRCPEYMRETKKEAYKKIVFKIDSNKTVRTAFYDQITANKQQIEKEYFQGKNISLDTRNEGKMILHIQNYYTSKNIQFKQE